MDRDKLALINHWSKCIKGKGWQLHVPLVHSQKSTNMTISPMLCPAVTVVGEENPNLCQEPIRLQDSLPCPLGKEEKALLNNVSYYNVWPCTYLCLWKELWTMQGAFLYSKPIPIRKTKMYHNLAACMGGILIVPW